MVCSDCHDPHGQLERNLKAETVNLLCYKCHAEKQGPFAYPHPPVTENCAICHEPHGTVADNLLRQPPVFLCLRCHSGHRRLATPSHPARGGAGQHRYEYRSPATLVHQLHAMPYPDPRQRPAVADDTEFQDHVPIKVRSIPVC